MSEASAPEHAAGPRPGPLTARRTKTRERVIRAAVGVFAERGISGASVEEICEAAGFTRGAFYSNFTDKDDLVLSVLRGEVAAQYVAAEQAVQAMRAAQQAGHSLDSMVAAALSVFGAATVVDRAQTIANQEMLLHAARTPSLREPYREYLDHSVRRFADLMRDALVAADLEFTVDFADAVELLRATHHQILTTALVGGPADLRLLRVLLLAITRPVR